MLHIYSHFESFLASVLVFSLPLSAVVIFISFFHLIILCVHISADLRKKERIYKAYIKKAISFSVFFVLIFVARWFCCLWFFFVCVFYWAKRKVVKPVCVFGCCYLCALFMHRFSFLFVTVFSNKKWSFFNFLFCTLSIAVTHRRHRHWSVVLLSLPFTRTHTQFYQYVWYNHHQRSS